MTPPFYRGILRGLMLRYFDLRLFSAEPQAIQIFWQVGFHQSSQKRLFRYFGIWTSIPFIGFRGNRVFQLVFNFIKQQFLLIQVFKYNFRILLILSN